MQHSAGSGKSNTTAWLAGALSGQRARIIIATVQKFPFVLDEVDDLPDPRVRPRS